MTLEKMGREVEKRFEDYDRRIYRLERKTAYDSETLRQVVKYLRVQFGGRLFRRDY